MGKQSKDKERQRLTAQSFCRLEGRLAFARKMVDSAGDVSKAEDVFAFFCYFVAFNILYEFHRHNGTHWEAVKRFLEEEYASVDELVHPGSDPRIKLLNEKVLNGHKTADDGDMEEKECIRNEPSADIRVFLRILQIRNNLFHGSKALNNHRDMPLIREANVVLREFLTGYFERKIIKRTPKEGVEE